MPIGNQEPATVGFQRVLDSGRDIERSIRRIVQAELANVRDDSETVGAVYPVDARGLITMPKALTAQGGIGFAPGQSKAALDMPIAPTGTHTLQMIADSTGGRAFFNTNDLKNAIRNALYDSEITYTLGFYADSKSLDSQFHDLKVTLKRPDKYQDVEVRFRKGYMAEPDPPPTADERASNIRDVIWSPLEATAIRFTGKIEPASPGVKIALSIGRDQITLTAQDGRRSGVIDVVFVQQSVAGDELEKIEQKVPININQAQYDALSQGLLLERTIVPAANAVQLRVVLCDRTTGQLGSLTIPLKH